MASGDPGCQHHPLLSRGLGSCCLPTDRYSLGACLEVRATPDLKAVGGFLAAMIASVIPIKYVVGLCLEAVIKKYRIQKFLDGFAFCFSCVCAHVCAKSLQSRPTLCNPMDCSPPGSSVHGILQARILAWTVLPSRTQRSKPASSVSPPSAGRFFTTGTPWEAHI